MSIRRQMAQGYAAVLSLALAGTTTGLLVGSHLQSQALAAQEIAIAERKLLSDLQVKILGNRPTQQLSPYLNDSAQLEIAVHGMFSRTVEIQALLESRTALYEAKSILREEPTAEEQALLSLLDAYEADLAAFQVRLQEFAQSAMPIVRAANDVTEAQKLLISFVQGPEFANLVKLPTELIAFVSSVEATERGASEALAQAIALQTQIIFASLLLSIAIASAIAHYTSRAIAQPIQGVTKLADTIIQKQDFALRVPLVGKGEVVSLGQSFNQLIAKLNHLLEHVGQKNQDLETALEQLHRQQMQLVQSEKMSSLGQLVAGEAHEINNPVNIIHGNLVHDQREVKSHLDYIQMCQARYPELSDDIQLDEDDIDIEFVQEDLPKILTSMRTGTQRIREIVLSLRTFSRMDEAEIKKVDVHEGIESTLLLLQHRLAPKSGTEQGNTAISVRRDYDALPLVECAAGHLNQVFMNSLLNAIDALTNPKASRLEPAQITIRTSTLDEDWIQVEIADNGSGMTEAVRARLFEPFFTTKPVGKGTGMGMSLSYQIVTDQHRGKLECFSTLGEGTAIILQLPCVFEESSKLADGKKKTT
ncbi:MAG: sensor histidine kinase [Phormidesmis sp.]